MSKHEKSPSSGPMSHGKGRISQQRPQFLDYSENILLQALVKHSLDSRDAKKHQFTQFTHSVCSHAGPLSRNNPGATTEGATARMIGHHLKHCQTPSKIINGLNLLRASKSPAEHVGRLDMARLHITRNTPFTGSAELVILSQSNRCLCGQLRSYISQEFANFKSQ